MPVIEQQLAAGGIRLANVLNKIFAAKPDTGDSEALLADYFDADAVVADE
jgi:hypothetical protein